METYSADKALRRTRAKLAHHLSRLSDDMSDRARRRHERRVSQARKVEATLRYDAARFCEEL